MNSNDFRSDRSRCLALARVLEMQVVRQAFEAAFEDLDLMEAHMLNHNPDASATMEIRLTNQRKGFNDFKNSLKLMSIPIETAPKDEPSDFGAGQEAVARMNQPDGWVPVDQL